MALIGLFVSGGVALASPDVRKCTVSQSFAISSIGYSTLGIPGIFAELDNKSGSTATLSLGKSGSKATSYGISATEGVDAGVIFAKVAASSTQSISTTHTTTYTSSASLNVPGKTYGWVGAATKYVVGHGTVTILYGNCDTAKVAVSKYEFPEKNSGDPYIDDTTKTDLASPPWAMAP